uniref:hypothetical protein n=1 Tax=Parerythrobacter lutipelagi TaxID=1964208 RepID=UPI0010F5E493|nr:hypothetical protein [Parerythrobacter lutipelagi]
MELVKAIPLGGLLTGIVSLVIGSTGSRGGQLAIHHMAVGSYDLWWSWPLFLAGTGLAWGLMMMQR